MSLELRLQGPGEGWKPRGPGLSSQEVYNAIFIASLPNKVYGTTGIHSVKNADPLYESLIVEEERLRPLGDLVKWKFFFFLIFLSLSFFSSFFPSFSLSFFFPFLPPSLLPFSFSHLRLVQHVSLLIVSLQYLCKKTKPQLLQTAAPPDILVTFITTLETLTRKKRCLGQKAKIKTEVSKQPRGTLHHQAKC